MASTAKKCSNPFCKVYSDDSGSIAYQHSHSDQFFCLKCCHKYDEYTSKQVEPIYETFSLFWNKYNESTCVLFENFLGRIHKKLLKGEKIRKLLTNAQHEEFLNMIMMFLKYSIFNDHPLYEYLVSCAIPGNPFASPDFVQEPAPPSYSYTHSYPRKKRRTAVSYFANDSDGERSEDSEHQLVHFTKSNIDVSKMSPASSPSTTSPGPTYYI